MSYDGPNSTVRREAAFITVAGATTEGAKFRQFQAFKLKAVHAAVITAGTATTMGFDVYRGTTSVGAIAISTATAGSNFNSAALNLEVASMQQISVKSLADATGVAHILYEYEMLPSAQMTT